MTDIYLILKKISLNTEDKFGIHQSKYFTFCHVCGMRLTIWFLNVNTFFGYNFMLINCSEVKDVVKSTTIISARNLYGRDNELLNNHGKKNILNTNSNKSLN